ncbi:MAG: nitroreductase family deazaflavin-dependent oxidoreductase [Caulobacteraceae bacterium]|nr:nitroreductase family deazaflavin-dependent oxidoreductase [Caulobacteraceae bacterium]
MVDMKRAMAKRAAFYQDHLRRYLTTDGQDGYLYDMSAGKPYPASPVLPTLVLRTYGRKTGRVMMNVLLYAPWGPEYIIVGSKGGNDLHPAWYLNLVSRAEAEFQVRASRFRGRWRELSGGERNTVWDYLVKFYPNYQAYQDRTQRLLPVIVLTPVAEVQERWSVAEIGSQ